MIELTNIQNLEILTRNASSVSQTQLLHVRLEEEVRVEAMYSFSLQSGNSCNVVLLVQHQSKFVNELENPLKKMKNELMPALVSPSPQVYSCSFENFAWPLSLEFHATGSPLLSKVSSLFSRIRTFSIRSLTNLLSPVEILIHEWDSSLDNDSILISTRVSLGGNWLPLPTQESWYFHESNLLVLMIRHLKVKYILDMPHDHQIVRTLQHLSS